MRPKRKTRKDGRKEEAKAANAIQLKQLCERELKALLSIVRKKDFPKSLKLQNEAALIARGITFKLQAYKAERQESDETFLEVVSGIMRQFGAVWDKQSLNVILSGPDGGPVEMDHTVKSPMDIRALNDAIKRDQER